MRRESVMLSFVILAACAPVSYLEAHPVESVPIYAGPHVRDYEVIGVIEPADRIVLVGMSGDSWVAFEYGSDLAWVQEFFLEIDGNPRRLAEVEPRELTHAGAQELPPSSPSTMLRGASWRDASSHLGDYTTICGPVVSTHFASTSDGQPTFLNMGEDYPSNARFVVLIWGEDRERFPSPPEDLYSGQSICVTGEVEIYEGVYEIEATTPTSIDLE